MTYIRVANTEYLAHHGIPGQKWGVRRYQNQDGTLTNAGLARDRKAREKEVRRENRQKQSEAKRAARSSNSFSAKQKTGGSAFASKYAPTGLKNGRLIQEAHANSKESSNFISQPFYQRTSKQLARESRRYDKQMFRNLKSENSRKIQDSTSQLYKGRLLREVTSNSKEGSNFVSSFINTNSNFRKR